MKKLLTKLLGAAFVVGALATPSTADANKTVYFRSTDQQTKVVCYTWGSNDGTKDCTKLWGNLWSVELTDGVSGCIFCKNSWDNSNKLTLDCTGLNDGYICPQNTSGNQTAKAFSLEAYVCGKGVLGNWNTSTDSKYKFASTSTKGEYTITCDLTNEDNGKYYFRIYDKTYNSELQPATSVDATSTQKIQGTGQANSWYVTESGTYTITFNYFTGEVKAVKGSSTVVNPPVENTKQLWAQGRVTGDASAWDNGEGNGVELILSNGFFSGTIKPTAPSGKTEPGYMHFWYKEGSTSKAYGAKDTNVAAKYSKAHNENITEGSKNWAITPGEYTIHVAEDLSYWYVDEAEAGTEQTTTDFTKKNKWGLIGEQFGGWSESNTTALTGENGTYTITTNFEANKQFKLFNANGTGEKYWGLSDTKNGPDIEPTDGDHTAYNTGYAGNMKFSTAKSNVTITITTNVDGNITNLNFSGIDGSTGGDGGDEGDEAEDTPVPAGKNYIWLNNTDNWSAPHVHAWNDNTTCTQSALDGNQYNGWPGDAMTYNKKRKLWLWEAPEGVSQPTTLIISDNGNGDKKFEKEFKNQAIYKCDGTYSGGTDEWDTPPVDLSQISGTLPVIYINVFNEKEHTSVNNDYFNPNYTEKDYKFANYYIEVPEGVDYDWAQAVGSVDEPLPMEMKLRGNYTRTGYSKKPYKLKLGAKEGLLGLSKSKHFALIAHADDDKGFMRNFVGFELGKLIGLPWTPSQKPVEVVINGEYRGLYFLTESIRIEKDRINITELADGEEDPTLCSGGYLVELDNYPEDSSVQISMEEKGCNKKGYDPLRVTFDTPAEYSDIQRKFVNDQFTTMNDLMASVNKSDDLWKYMDLDDAVRYYLVMEVISHWEAYHGSTYLFRDRGEGQKWHFSPLWDCGNAFAVDQWSARTDFIYNTSRFGNTWIPSMVQNGSFDKKLKETWAWFMSTGYKQLSDKIDEYSAQIAEAAKYDYKRWKNAGKPNSSDAQDVKCNNDIPERTQFVKDFLKDKIEWLEKQWGTIPSTEQAEPARDETPAAPLPTYITLEEPKPDPTKTYIYVADEANWVNSDHPTLYAYIYNSDSDKSADWPGFEMNFNSKLTYGKYTNGLYFVEIPSNYKSGYVIISTSNNGNRYPANMQGGMQLPGKNAFYVTGETSVSGLDAAIVVPEEVVEEEHKWSGTLPVLFVTTNDGAGVPADKTKTKGTWTMTYADGSEAVANKNNKLSIKGRGSDTWECFEKKPYKIEFDKKQTLAGHSESKHFVLLPYLGFNNNNDEINATLYNLAGYELARRIGMKWVPNAYPIELVIDSVYQGLYYMTENIRPSISRVPVADFSDLDDDTVDIKYNADTYANEWLVEIDNENEAECEYSWTSTGKNGIESTYRVVPSNPDFGDVKDKANEEDATTSEKPYAGIDETLRGHLATSMNALVAAAESAEADLTSTDWQNVIDIDEAVRFLIVQELMDDSRAFDTSFYMWQTSGHAWHSDSKWMFGPVWDFSGAFRSQGNKKSTIHHGLSNSALINKLYNNEAFREALSDAFFEFSGLERKMNSSKRLAPARVVADAAAPLQSIGSYLADQESKIAEAVKADAGKWGQYYGEDITSHPAETVESYIMQSANALATEWADGGAFTGIDGIMDAGSDVAPVYFDATGLRIAEPQAGSFYIVRRGNHVSKEIAK